MTRCARLFKTILAAAFGRLQKRRSTNLTAETLLLRIGRRRVSDELPDPDTFCDLEFQDPNGPGLDRRLSVYQIPSPQTIQAHAEHYARLALGPQGRHNLDLNGLTPAPKDDPLPNGFAFTAERHREIPFRSESAVRAMATALHASLSGRRHTVSKKEVKEYARQRRDEGDPEWRTFYAGSPVSW